MTAMTTITWTPDPTQPLIVARESETNLLATITAVADAASTGSTTGSTDAVTVESMTWSTAIPLPRQMTVTCTGNTLTLTIPNFAGLFPVEIDYLESAAPGSLTTASNWQDIPASAPEIIAMRPDSSNLKFFTITVNACDGAGQVIESAAFTLNVYANYNLVRDALVEAVNARR